VGHDAAASFNTHQPIVAIETNGVWSPAYEDTLPGSHWGIFAGVSCTDATDCTAVGSDYSDGSSIALRETAGLWGPVIQVPGDNGGLFSVSCSDGLDCTAVGQSNFYQTEIGGTWGLPVAVQLAGGGIYNFWGVSCIDAADCTAAGNNYYATETAGVWGPLTLFSGPVVNSFMGLSCTHGGDCTAVGSDDNGVAIRATSDAVAPTVTVQSLSGGAFFVQGQSVLANYSCTDEVGGSGVASCAGTVATGSLLDTSSLGPHSFVVNTTDHAGNARSVTETYNVVASVDVTDTLGNGGGTVTTDTAGTGTSVDVPLQTAVTSPNGGAVEIAQVAVTQATPPDFLVLNLEADITTTPADPATPLTVEFSLNSALLASAGADASNVVVFRDGVPIGPCDSPDVAVASPDPCVFARTTLADGTADIRVYSSHASHWNFGRALTSPPSITTTALAGGTVGLRYTDALTASGGTGPYLWSIVSGALPAGVTLDPATGSLSGVPPKAGLASFTAQVTDAASHLATAALSINVGATPNPSTSTVGVPYWHNVPAFAGVAPYHWTVAAGHFPGGLNLDSATGAISGTPTVEGKFVFTVQVIDSKANTPTKVRTKMTVTVAPEAITVSPNFLPAAALNVKSTVTLTATGGTAPYKFKVTSGTLPTGMKLSPKGIIGGKPTAVGTSMFTVAVTDKFKYTQTSTYFLSVS
jgi:hypothetical protein